MAADILGQRMHDDVGAEIERPAEIGRGHRVVDDHRHAVAVGDLGETFDVDDVAGRVADRLEEHRLGLLVDGLVEAVEIVVGDHAHLDALAREGVHEQVVGAAIELG